VLSLIVEAIRFREAVGLSQIWKDELVGGVLLGIEVKRGRRSGCFG